MIRASIIALVAFVSASLTACSDRLVAAPPATEEGTFFVHVVRSSDESLPKILTWYTGTTLSQSLVARYNPYVLERSLEVGDRIMIPVEMIANDKPYGDEGAVTTNKTPNLLMGESDTPPPTATPPSGLETFNDDTDPDSKGGEPTNPPSKRDDDTGVIIPEELVGS